MKKVVTTVEVQGEGLESLLGEEVILFCGNYFYTGKLAGVNATCVLLEQPSIVYETGPFNSKGYTDSQRLHCDKLYVQVRWIEAFGVSK